MRSSTQARKEQMIWFYQVTQLLQTGISQHGHTALHCRGGHLIFSHFVLNLPLSCTLGGIIKQFLESLACLWWYVLFVQCSHANSPPKITSVPMRSGLEGLQYILCDNIQNSKIICGTIQLADGHLTSMPLKHILFWNKYTATYENFRQCFVSFGSVTLGRT